MRPAPLPDAQTAFFWEAAARGELLILRCTSCGLWLHPPRPVCRACGSRTLAPQPVSGRGTVYSFTITHRAVAGYEPPFAVVLVELDEQPGLRLVSNMPGVPLDRIHIGMRARVRFERIDDGLALPMFEPEHA